MRPVILIIDYDPIKLSLLKELLAAEGVDAKTATSGKIGVAAYRHYKNQISLVLIGANQNLEGEVELSGVDLIRGIKVINRDAKVVEMSASNKLDQIIELVKSILFSAETREAPHEIGNRRDLINNVLQMVGCSRELAKVARLVSQFALFDEPVLIRGESGTGKEGVARAIHENSERRQRAFVAINCAAFTHDLLEGELFGYEKGAFTGALRNKIGLMEQAHGGTVFLDEIGDMPLLLQAKILRALQEKTVQPIGGLPRKVNFRVVAATHRNLKLLVEKGEFREDLYYRLKYLDIEVAPLRERPEDIGPMALYFLDQMASKTSVEKYLSDKALKELKGYGWPGNVRELEATIKKAYILAEKTITANALRAEIHSSPYQSVVSIGHGEDLLTYREFLKKVEDTEKWLLNQALLLARNSKSRAASLLGMNHSTMNYRRAILGIDKDLKLKKRIQNPQD